jgi:hypothetical protein
MTHADVVMALWTITAPLWLAVWFLMLIWLAILFGRHS